MSQTPDTRHIREYTFCFFLEELRQHGLHQWLESLPLGDTSNPDLRLTIGAVIMEEMRATVESVTGFRCSVGISHNKVYERSVVLVSILTTVRNVMID